MLSNKKPPIKIILTGGQGNNNPFLYCYKIKGVVDLYQKFR